MDKPQIETVTQKKVLKGIYVGEFSKRKRIQYILSLKSVAEEPSNCHLEMQLIGCDKENEQYKEEFKALSHEKTLEKISQHHILFLLSEREAMGAVVLEALAHGVFVVLSAEVGAATYVTDEESYQTKHPGIIHFNSIGCIIDPNAISPNQVWDWLHSHKDMIHSNREHRSVQLSDHFV